MFVVVSLFWFLLCNAKWPSDHKLAGIFMHASLGGGQKCKPVGSDVRYPDTAPARVEITLYNVDGIHDIEPDDVVRRGVCLSSHGCLSVVA